MSVGKLGDIILEDWKVGRYGPDINQGHLFFVCLVGRIQSRQKVLKCWTN